MAGTGTIFDCNCLKKQDKKIEGFAGKNFFPLDRLASLECCSLTEKTEKNRENQRKIEKSGIYPVDKKTAAS